MIDRYSSLGQRLAKLLESEVKCRQFSQYLMKNNPNDRQIEDGYAVIDESTLETVQVEQKCYQTDQKPQNNKKFVFFQDQCKTHQTHPKNTGKNTRLPSNQLTEFSQQNEFMINQYNQEPNEHEQAFFIQQKKQDSELFVQAETQTIEEHTKRTQINKIEDEYFELTIFNESATKEGQNYLKQHQVKIFSSINSIPHASVSNNAFNLSNFSSFNGIHSNQNPDSQISQEESTFYSKEFVYLIKKIEMIQGKKLSSQGISKISNQLQSLLPRNFLNEISFNQLQVPIQQQKIKSVSKSNFLKKTKIDKNPKINCDSNTQKKLKYEINIQSQLKSKSKPKNASIQITAKSKNLSNKQNVNFDFESEKLKNKRQNDRSTSPLSYRVLMEKKKTQKQKSQERKNKILATKNSQKQSPDEHSLSYNAQSQSFGKQSNLAKLDRSFQLEKQSKQTEHMQKKNRLKIIMQNPSQGKSKTLTFEYQSKSITLQKQVEDYCMKNKIQSKNIKSIQQALSQHKPIITIKE